MPGEGEHDQEAADDGPNRGHLSEGEPHPERREEELEQHHDAHLGGGRERRGGGKADEAQADAAPLDEEGEPEAPLWPPARDLEAHRRGWRQGMPIGGAHDQREGGRHEAAEAGGGRHVCLAVAELTGAPRQGDVEREGDAGEGRAQIATKARAVVWRSVLSAEGGRQEDDAHGNEREQQRYGGRRTHSLLQDDGAKGRGPQRIEREE